MMQIEDLWAGLSRVADGAQRRVDADHPHGIYADFEPPAKPGLVVVCLSKPPDPPTLKSIRIERGQRTDGRWFLRIQLAQPQLITVFSELCKDIIATTRSGINSHELGIAVTARLDHWYTLLQRETSRLDRSGFRGLLGELLVLQYEIVPSMGLLGAIDSWTGPFRLPQDFKLPAGDRIEVKTVDPTAESVVINGLAQLDGDGFPLDLFVVRLDEAKIDDPSAFSGEDIVGSLRAAMAGESAVLERFDGLLRLAGWREDHVERSRRFRLVRIDKHRVEGSFPRLTRKTVLPGIAAATYRIVLPG